MKKIYMTIAYLIIGLSAFAQSTWQAHSVVSNYWPNNDVKSYNGKLYVASNDGLFSSSDNGSTWLKLTEGLSGLSDLVEMQFTNNGTIYVRQNSIGALKSTDMGQTWTLDTLGMGGNYGAALLYYDSVSDKIFFGVGYNKYALYSKSPNDAAWVKVANIPSTLNNFSPVQMTRKGNKLFVVDIYMRVIESADNGVTWTQKAGNGLVSAESQVGPSRFLSIGNDLYYGIAGVWKSSDDGDTWTQIDKNFASSDVRCLYYDGSVLYASVYSQRKTYRSTDLGNSWDEFGGTGSWFFKAMAKHNGALFGVIHAVDSIYIYGNTSTGINTDNENLISIYPNPAQNHLTIENHPDETDLKIFDITGKIVFEKKIQDVKDVLDVSNLESGLYTMHLINKNISFKKKLIIN